MKKTYITLVTLFIISVALILTRISDVKEEAVVTQPEISDVQISTTSKPVPNPVVGENLEGEANPDIMKLDMKSWTWIQTTYPKGTTFLPKTNKFVLGFGKNNFSSKTDCNGVGGEYIVNGKSIKFDKMMSTLMYCEGSQESEYGKMLEQVVSYEFTNRGELFLNLKDGGTMLFK